MPESDEGIIQRVRDGDKEAFGELVVIYQRAVYGIALAMIGDAEEAEDVAQSAFVQAFSGLGELRDGQRFSSWLFAIARNRCRDWLRQRSRRIALVGDPSELPSADPPELPDSDERQALSSARDQAVRQVVDSLPQHYRAVVVLRYAAELSYEDIAQELGLSASAARVRCHRARRILEDRLGERLSSGEERRGP